MLLSCRAECFNIRCSESFDVPIQYDSTVVEFSCRIQVAETFFGSSFPQITNSSVRNDKFVCYVLPCNKLEILR